MGSQKDTSIFWFTYDHYFTYFWHAGECAQAVCGNSLALQLQVLLGDGCLWLLLLLLLLMMMMTIVL